MVSLELQPEAQPVLPLHFASWACVICLLQCAFSWDCSELLMLRLGHFDSSFPWHCHPFVFSCFSYCLFSSDAWRMVSVATMRKIP